MPARRRLRKHDAWSTALKSAELAWAAPQVIAHRLGRMAVAGPLPSPRDTAEFTRMWSEKVTAFSESWTAAAFAGYAANQTVLSSLMRGFWSPWRATSPLATMSHLHDATWRVLGAGLRPVHRTAVDNARRLAQRPRR